MTPTAARCDGFPIADLRPAFAELRDAADPRTLVFLANDRGDYLVHPDPGRAFGFELGRPSRWQDDLPPLADLFTSGAPLARAITTPRGERLAAAVASTRLAEGPGVTVIATLPGEAVTAAAAGVRHATVIAGLTTTALAAALAVMLARSLTGPLAQLTRAAERLGHGDPVTVPTTARGEVGVLARAFERMSLEVRDKTSVVEWSDDAILTKSVEGTITSWNPGATRLYGYAAEEAIGQRIDLIVPPERRSEIDTILQHARAGDVTRHLETVRVTKSGRAIDVSVTASPVKSAGGTISSVSVITRDVTERKRAEARFRLAIEAAPGGMILVDREGRIALVIAAIEAMFGYPRGELLDQPIEILVPARFRAEHPGPRQSYLARPETREMGAGRDLSGRRKDGTEFPLEIGLTPINTADASLVMASVVDLTQRRAAAQALVAQTEELQRSNAELEHFAYVASHDLQEPLRMAASYTALLAERYRGRLDERADRYIHFAVDGAHRMQKLINDLLAYSRVGAQGKPLQPTDAAAVVRAVLHSLRGATIEAGAEVHCDPLPVVDADETQLGQVFQNLVANAVKFRSTRPPRIAISARREGPHWVFAVADNGIGIEAQYSERIFQMFQRLHERGKYEGTGIGLAVVKKIVERHGGRIWFESAPEQGTTFFFTMPATEAS